MTPDVPGSAGSPPDPDHGPTPPAVAPPLARRELFPVRGPLDIALRLADARVSLDLREDAGAGPASVTLEIDGVDGPAAAAALAEMSLACDGRSLQIVAARRRLAVPVRVSVTAPAGSSLTVAAATLHLAVAGSAGGVSASCRSGHLQVEHVRGRCSLRSGSGTVRAGVLEGGVDVRLGSGSIELAQVAGPGGRLVTGGGSIGVGTVDADLAVRTGGGSVRIDDAASGQVRVKAGLATISVGVRAGAWAHVVLVSRGGRAVSELPVQEAPPPGVPAARPPLRIVAAAAGGDVVVRPAAVPAA